MARTTADALCEALQAHGVSDVFGLPGSETIDLWEALRRRSTPRTVVVTNELAGSFMANGYARASGRVGVLLTIGGPGFTYALTGITEARLDSAPVVHVLVGPRSRPDGGYALQSIPQADAARPLAKAVIELSLPEEVTSGFAKAFRLASSGEPGPVLVQLASGLLGEPARDGGAEPQPVQVAPPELGRMAELVRAASRPLLLCGQGAAGASDSVIRLAELLPAPVLTTTSGRGVVPETHPLCLAHDVPGAAATEVNRFVAECDLVLVLGCKLSHNGSYGFRLQLPESRLVRVDASRDVMGRAYPAQLEIAADVQVVVDGLLALLGDAGGASVWNADEIGRRRARLSSVGSSLPEPTLAGLAASRFFALLRDAVDERSVVSTDSGLHQYLVRRYLPVIAPRTLVVPTDFQAMGFGIPAAIGGAVATGRPAVAIVGDGGLNITGLELLTAVRERIRLVVVVLVDRHFGLIRAQQLRRTGHPAGVDIPVSDLELLAASVGAAHRRLGTAPEADLEAALSQDGVTVVEVPVEDTGEFARARAQGLALSLGKAVLGPLGPRRIADVLRGRGRG